MDFIKRPVCQIWLHLAEKIKVAKTNSLFSWLFLNMNIGTLYCLKTTVVTLEMRLQAFMQVGI